MAKVLFLVLIRPSLAPTIGSQTGNISLKCSCKLLRPVCPFHDVVPLLVIGEALWYSCTHYSATMCERVSGWKVASIGVVFPA